MTSNPTMRRRWRWMSIVAAANLAAVGLVAGPSQAQAVSLCSGTAENFTIAGDLAVPAGASCSLVNVTVTGNVVVRADANLSLQESTVRGDLRVRENGFAETTESSVVGVTTLRQAFGAFVVDSELAGGVDARQSGFFFSEGTTHGADVRSAQGQTVVVSGWVSGAVRSNLDLLADVRDSVVTGAININQAEVGSAICRSEVDGDVTVRASGELVQLGTGGPVTDCEFNVLGGGLALHDNTAEIQIGDNVIRGNLGCSGNEATPAGAGNRLRGATTGQCADLAPAAPAFGADSSVLTADQRQADVRAEIEDRSVDAEAEAAAAGPADL